VVAVPTGKLSTGKILKFDEARGYGFIAPDEGGEDVFLHANALTDEKQAYHSGVAVEFDVLKDARGLKAMSVRILGTDDAAAPAVNEPAATPAGASNPPEPADDDTLCDVLSATDLRNDLIELYLEYAPSLTGAQITALNGALITLARQHGWVED